MCVVLDTHDIDGMYPQPNFLHAHIPFSSLLFSTRVYIYKHTSTPSIGLIQNIYKNHIFLLCFILSLDIL
jgi:hypothetical protein